MRCADDALAPLTITDCTRVGAQLALPFRPRRCLRSSPVVGLARLCCSRSGHRSARLLGLGLHGKHPAGASLPVNAPVLPLGLAPDASVDGPRATHAVGSTAPQCGRATQQPRYCGTRGKLLSATVASAAACAAPRASAAAHKIAALARARVNNLLRGLLCHVCNTPGMVLPHGGYLNT